MGKALNYAELGPRRHKRCLVRSQSSVKRHWKLYLVPRLYPDEKSIRARHHCSPVNVMLIPPLKGARFLRRIPQKRSKVAVKPNSFQAKCRYPTKTTIRRIRALVLEANLSK